VVELAPAILPAVRDVAQLRTGERGEHTVGSLAVGGELDRGAVVGILEALGRELDEPGAKLLRPGGGSGDGGAPQPNALLSLSKKLLSRR
jgi:hypothetical protein